MWLQRIHSAVQYFLPATPLPAALELILGRLHADSQFPTLGTAVLPFPVVVGSGARQDTTTLFARVHPENPALLLRQRLSTGGGALGGIVGLPPDPFALVFPLDWTAAAKYPIVAPQLAGTDKDPLLVTDATSAALTKVADAIWNPDGGDTGFAGDWYLILADIFLILLLQLNAFFQIAVRLGKLKHQFHELADDFRLAAAQPDLLCTTRVVLDGILRLQATIRFGSEALVVPDVVQQLTGVDSDGLRAIADSLPWSVPELGLVFHGLGDPAVLLGDVADRYAQLLGLDEATAAPEVHGGATGDNVPNGLFVVGIATAPPGAPLEAGGWYAWWNAAQPTYGAALVFDLCGIVLAQVIELDDLLLWAAGIADGEGLLAKTVRQQMYTAGMRIGSAGLNGASVTAIVRYLFRQILTDLFFGYLDGKGVAYDTDCTLQLFPWMDSAAKRAIVDKVLGPVQAFTLAAAGAFADLGVSAILVGYPAGPIPLRGCLVELLSGQTLPDCGQPDGAHPDCVPATSSLGKIIAFLSVPEAKLGDLDPCLLGDVRDFLAVNGGEALSDLQSRIEPAWAAEPVHPE